MGSVRIRDLGRLSALGGWRLSPCRPVAVAVAAGADRAEAFEAWQREVDAVHRRMGKWLRPGRTEVEVAAEHARPIEREAESLDVSAYHARWAEDVSLGPVMLHEYVRHNGHADFLREAVDCVVGV